MKIGFIGLGNVGGKLAGSLLRNNFDVTVRDIDEDLTNSFKKLGAKIAKSPKELAEQSDLIITSLPSPEVSSEVMESEDGILNGLSEKEFLENLKQYFNISPRSTSYKPIANKNFGMYHQKKWYSLDFIGNIEKKHDILSYLDINIINNLSRFSNVVH